MKITYISSSTIPSRAANSIHVMKMCQAFARNGHEVVLIAPDRKNDVEQGVEDAFAFYGVEKCFEIVKLPWLPIKGRTYIYGLLAGRKAKTLKPDLVYCRNLAGCFFAALFSLPVVFESHGPTEDRGSVSELMFRGLIRSPCLQKLVVITHALKKDYEAKYLQTRGKIQVAPDGADPIPEGVIPVELPNKGKRLQVGYVGHLYRGRGVDVIVALAKTCDWADFHLVGGSEKDIVFWKDRTVNLKNIIFHGFVSPVNAERIRVAFDILLAPYQHEVSVSSVNAGGGGNTVHWMSPIKIFEYMAASKAIICSDLPALREVMDHDRNVLLCPPDDVDAWENGLKRLRDEPELRHRLGAEANRHFTKNFTWQARAKQLLGERS